VEAAEIFCAIFEFYAAAAGLRFTEKDFDFP